MENKRFFYSRTMTETLTEQQKIQLPYYVTMTVAVMLIFLLVAVTLVATGSPEGGALMLLGVVFLAISYSLFRKGKIEKAASLTTVGLLIAESIVTFFLDIGTNPYGLYRILAFTLFLFIAKFILSAKAKELFAFALIASIMFLFKTYLSHNDMPADLTETYIAAAGICVVCIIGTTLLFISLFRMFLDLNKYAENEKIKVESALVKITNVLTESKQGLEVGNLLSEKSTNATLDLQKMATVFSSLKTSANELTTSISTVLGLFSTIEKNSGVMQEGSKSQNASITESSVALTEISTNISSVNQIATQRSENMRNLLEGLKSQKTLVQEALNEVQKVKESSTSIGEFIHTVEDIANQTGLLAMNASIEAAHAGSAGKGFAVIAQEIRKLSEETAKNAAYIGDVLKGNEQTVESAANAVISFASQSEKSSEELQSTIAALDGILMGISEMDIGTRGVMNSMQIIVEASRQNGDIVDDVSGKIVQQREIMDNISGFAKTLQAEVASANTQITSVQSNLETIKNASDENIKVSSSVNNALQNIDI